MITSNARGKDTSGESMHSTADLNVRLSKRLFRSGAKIVFGAVVVILMSFCGVFNVCKKYLQKIEKSHHEEKSKNDLAREPDLSVAIESWQGF